MILILVFIFCILCDFPLINTVLTFDLQRTDKSWKSGPSKGYNTYDVGRLVFSDIDANSNIQKNVTTNIAAFWSTVSAIWYY